MYDPLYVRARKVLLDAIGALGAHADQVILIGAQAVYVHAGQGDIAEVPFTQDADLALNTLGLSEDPRIEECMRGAGFTQRAGAQPGAWVSREGVDVDLMVPEALAGAGSRAASIPPHDRHAARRARGLEAAIVDNGWHAVASLEAADDRVARIRVAGPAALLVSKLIKLEERFRERPASVEPKDALDVYRLLRAAPTARLASSLRTVRGAKVSARVTDDAISWLATGFGTADSTGTLLLIRSLAGSPDEEVARVAAPELVRRLLDALR